MKVSVLRKIKHNPNNLGPLIIGVIGCVLCFILPIIGKSQTARSAFNFVENPSYTKVAALGGINITAGKDPLMFLSNPALLDSSGIHTPAFQYTNFPGGIQVATLGYNFLGAGSGGGILGIGLQYFDYGTFDGFDAIGVPLGEFGANEFALTVGYSRSQEVFRYGVNIKLLGSVLEGYQAYAAVMDFGVNYYHPEMDLVVGITAKNVGFVLSSYLEGQALELPTDLRIGGSFKPEYAPFRIHASLRNLQPREVDFFIPNLAAGRTELTFGDQFMRRIVLGVELLPSEHIQLRAGYNHLIRREFEALTGAGLGGFSGGFAFKVNRFELSYSRMFYNVPGGSNIFGITTAINEWRTF